MHDRLSVWRKERSLDRTTRDIIPTMVNILEEIHEGLGWTGKKKIRDRSKTIVQSMIDNRSEPASIDEQVDSLQDIIVFATNGTREMGYSTECSINQCLLEIESRDGSWSEEERKWVKFTTPEAMAKWYKADYKSCKIVNFK